MSKTIEISKRREKGLKAVCDALDNINTASLKLDVMKDEDWMENIGESFKIARRGLNRALYLTTRDMLDELMYLDEIEDDKRNAESECAAVHK